MRTLKDLKLSKKARLHVELWLREWLDMLIKNCDGQKGEVYRADFEKHDFFYFTNCNDILLNDPEATGHENNRKIQIRKRTIMAQLLIRNLLGGSDIEWKKNKCSHCGYHNRYIDALGDGTGHFLYCPNCSYTTIGTYPTGYDSCIDNIRKKIKIIKIMTETVPEEKKDLNFNELAKGLMKALTALLSHNFIKPTKKAHKDAEKLKVTLPKKSHLKTAPGFLKSAKKKEKLSVESNEDIF